GRGVPGRRGHRRAQGIRGAPGAEVRLRGSAGDRARGRRGTVRRRNRRRCGAWDCRILTTDGTIIDVKTASRKPSGGAPDHAWHLATYTELLPDASGRARIDTLVGTRDPQFIQLEHTPGERGKRLIERLYPMVAEGIAGGLFLPNRNSSTCSRRYCAFADACEREFGGTG